MRINRTPTPKPKRQEEDILNNLNAQISVEKARLRELTDENETLSKKCFVLNKEIGQKKKHLNFLSSKVVEKEIELRELNQRIREEEKEGYRRLTDIDELEEKAKKRFDEKLLNIKSKVDGEEKRLIQLENEQKKAEEARDKAKNEMTGVLSHIDKYQAILVSKKDLIASTEQEIKQKKRELEVLKDLGEKSDKNYEKKLKRVESLNATLESERKENEKIKKENIDLKRNVEKRKVELKETTEKLLGLIKREERVNKLVPEIKDICKKIGYNPNI